MIHHYGIPNMCRNIRLTTKMLNIKKNGKVDYPQANLMYICESFSFAYFVTKLSFKTYIVRSITLFLSLSAITEYDALYRN